MSKRRIRKALDGYATCFLPADADLWPAIQRQARPQPPSRVPYPVGDGARTRLRRAYPTALAALLVAALAATLLLHAISGLRGGGGQAAERTAMAGPQPACPLADAEPLSSCLFRLDTNLRRLDEVGLVQHIAAAQTVNGFTLTVWRAYADANRIAIGYTLAAPDPHTTLRYLNEYLGPDAIVLTDSTGRRHNPLSSKRNTGTGCPVHPCALPLAAAVALYDTAPLATGTTAETFRLTIPAFEVGAAAPGSPPAAREGGTAGARTGERVPGPWSIALTLPVVPARIAEVRQTVLADGVPLTLEQVVVTPLEVRLYVRGVSAPNGRATAPVPIPVVSGGDSTFVPPPPVDRIWTSPDGLTVYQMPAALDGWHGEWILTFQSGSQHDGHSWIFRFVVP